MKQVNMRQEQAAATRKKLLDSAQKMFAEHGYKGTSVRMINRDADIADGLMYHYFPGGKKEVFQAVVGENLKQMLEDLNRRISTEKCINMPLAEVLDLAYVSFAQAVESHLDILSILLKENEVREFVTNEQRGKACGNKAPWLTEILRTKAEQGEVCEMDFAVAALTVDSILINHVMAKIFGVGASILENAEFRKKIVDYQVQMWLKAERN